MARRLGLPLLIVLALIPNAPELTTAQDDTAREPEVMVIREGLVLPRIGAGGRSPVHVDPLESTLVDGTFTPPEDGQEVRTWQDETVRWKRVEADDKGWFESPELRGGYLYATVNSPVETIARLEARGHSTVYVNGRPRGGDVYNYGYVRHPVRLKRGVNEFLFAVGRGRLKASVRATGPGAVQINTADATLPDLVAGRAGTVWGSVPIENHSDSPLTVYGKSRGEPINAVVAKTTIPPMTTARTPMSIEHTGDLDPGEYSFGLTVLGPKGDNTYSATEATLNIRVRNETDPRRVTFRSKIDGTIQYYGLRPAKIIDSRADTPGIVLSLHGASVEAIGQAGAYSPKSWCHIVCPTNRRPFGFDWEDWGRLDALEVLEHAQATLEHDPTRVWLTGHSMGGHGTWTIGAHFPDKFAAIGASAGWESFWSYSGGGGHPEEYAVSGLLNRTANPSRTLLRKHNYKQQGVYILHGDADESVPVREARDMFKTLSEFHDDVRYHEQPGATHWWDAGHDHGTDCVDWQPMFDMFARRRLARTHEVHHVDFTTVCPGHSADCHWVTIHMQEVQLEPSRVQLRADPNRRRFSGTTSNVSRLRIRPDDVLFRGDSLKLNIDGQKLDDIPWPGNGSLLLHKVDGQWTVAEEFAPGLKGPHRYGWFKNAYRHEFVYVYGTVGSEAATRANYDKARYDLETWGYRANGSFEIIADSTFDPAEYPGRNVILVGNADTNSAWDKVLKDCPIRMANGRATIGGRTVEGDALAALFVYPRAGSDFASVGVIAGTGEKGMRLTNRIRTFVSGASFPDFILYGPEMLHEGTGGVRAAGYFGEDWKPDSGETVWNETINEE